MEYKMIKYCGVCRKKFFAMKGESKKRYCEECQKKIDKENKEVMEKESKEASL